jgi:beta-hydroxylase
VERCTQLIGENHVQVVCAKHPGGSSIRVCPHVLNAIYFGQNCAAPEYREYSAHDGDFAGFGIGAYFCPNCIAEHSLPPSGTSLSAVDAELFLDRLEHLFGATCQQCFEEWVKRGDCPPPPRTGFIEAAQFPFVDLLEANWSAIRDEYSAIPAETFEPWVQRTMHGGGWSVFGMFALGRPIPRACELCPRTTAVLRQVTGLSMAGFSRLAPRTRVQPHVGWAASMYRLHLALIVPPGCGLRVASETRQWQEGRCLVFDDTVEHEAWNDSDAPRGVLMLDFLRPGVSGRVQDHVPDEVRRYVDELFAAKRRVDVSAS